MFCSECGTDNPNTNQFCKNCGKAFSKVQVSPAQLQPTAYPSPVTTATTPGTVAQPGSTASWKKHKFAIAGIVCGLVSFVLVPYVFAILAIILGAIAVVKKDNLGFIGIIAAAITIFLDLFYFFIF